MAVEVQMAKINDYDGAHKRVTIDRECEFPLAAGDIVQIRRDAYSQTVASGAPTVAQIWQRDISGAVTPGTAEYELANSGGSHLSR